jgi:hypothetical protein
MRMEQVDAKVSMGCGAYRASDERVKEVNDEVRFTSASLITEGILVPHRRT